MTKFKLMQIYAKFFNPFKSYHETNSKGQILTRNPDFNVHGSRKASFIPTDKWQSMTQIQRKAI